MQRANQYGGITEQEYPTWLASIMLDLLPKMTANGSVLLVIRPHIRKGQISDYVLRTRLAIRETGWIEADEMIWHAPDKPPLGRNDRPRRTWEHILWFSRSRSPYCQLRDPTATSGWVCGRQRRKAGNGWGKANIVHGRQEFRRWDRTPRITDLISVAVGTIGTDDPHVEHPAMMPRRLATHLVEYWSKPGELVVDLFSGSGQTVLAALALGRRALGIEPVPEYVKLSRRRIRASRG